MNKLNYKYLATAIIVTVIAFITACSPIQNTPPVGTTQGIESTLLSPNMETTESRQDPTRPSAANGTLAPTTARDAALMKFSAPVTVAGEVLIVYGQVLDVNGNPLPNVNVEFWQTDSNGVYDHPRDPGTDRRDKNFQFFGTSTTAGDGYFYFRTIEPAQYGNRPKHIHVKVKSNGNTILTTQFYFVDDLAAAEKDGIFQQLGSNAHLLLLETEGTVDSNGNPVKLASKNLVIDIGLSSGNLPLTPSQAEGPYYPVIDISSYDNDLANSQ